MSVYSTLRITRTRAKAFVCQAMLHLDDDQLGDLMDNLLEYRLNNCIVVDDDDTENDDDVL